MGSSKGAEMSRQHKMHKFVRKKDRFNELPEGILYTIISKLTLKEAVKTSTLSKAWKFVWTCHPDLLFDSENVSGSIADSHGLWNPRPDRTKQLQRCKFVEQVDHIMNQRFTGQKIDSLTIRYNLGEDCASHITRWIQYAVFKGVEEINLDLSERCGFIGDDSSSSTYERYAFRCIFLAPSENECMVKRLQLVSCSLSPISWSNSLKSLKTIVLRDVKISDLQMKSFLLICPSLERLTLDNCQDLVNIEIAVLGLRLKFLSILNCLRLRTVDICAEDLLMLDYTGQRVEFFFKSVPRLTKMFLNFTGIGREEGVTYALSGLAHDLPQLAGLNLVCLMSLKNLKFAENAHTFSNIKQLLLTVLPFHDEDELFWICYILKAFPMLHKLDINLFSPSYIKQSNGINRHLPESPHKHLTQLVINGFNGYLHEVELLRYLLENAIGLEVLVISRWRRLYKGFENWDHERPSTRYKLSEEIVEWLHMAVVPTVNLQIQD